MEHAIVLEDGKISVAVDAGTGYTTLIRNPADESGMNWILGNSNWGHTDGFEIQSVEKKENSVIVSGINRADFLNLVIEKSVSNGKYIEKYRIENAGKLEYFLTGDSSGIHFPYSCNFDQRPGILSDSCISHVWCGGDASWIYSAKPDGTRTCLVCMIVEGRFANYSIDYNADVPGNNVAASHYRGAVVLHPEDCIIMPGTSLSFTFVYGFSKDKPDEHLIEWSPRAIFARADRYTLYPGETMCGVLETAFEPEFVSIELDGDKIPYRKDGKNIRWQWTASSAGEREFQIFVDERKTRMRINVISPVEEILKRRVGFIAEKQQYRMEGSHLDGAYLIYDRISRRRYFSVSSYDHNSARERLAMGAVVAMALQRSPEEGNEALAESLRQYRNYVERELFDSETMTVFNGAMRDSRWKRAYNYPLMADFFLECHLAFHDDKCLEYAAGIMLSYYSMIESRRQESPCVEDVRIIECLKKRNKNDLAEKLSRAVIHNADRVLAAGDAMFSEEVSYTQAQFYLKIISLCHAHRLTKNPVYLAASLKLLRNSEAFRGQQPDYHTNNLGVRYWDLFWFGKIRSFGDTMPQWLCALCGEMYFLLGEETGDERYFPVGKNILRNCLCVYDETGFGAAGYLMPRRIEAHSSDGGVRGGIPLGTIPGERFDDWANDQDWSLYYAALRNV